MTARDEILAAMPVVCARSTDGTFTPQDVIDEHSNAVAHIHVRQSEPTRV
jgi:hypothetical protein